MTNNTTPWQAIVNANVVKTLPVTENNVNTVKKAEGRVQKSYATVKNLNVVPKRYSFDDNGGGYQGL